MEMILQGINRHRRCWRRNFSLSVDSLIRAVEGCGCHLSSGEVGLKQVFSVLNRYGRDDVIYQMVMNDTPPSYRHFIDCGLTTLPEYWNYEELWYGMVRSRNHAMMGHVKEWFVCGILGVRRVSDGFEHIRIQPFVPKNVRWAKGSFLCGYGEISVEWHVVRHRVISICVRVPAGVTVETAAPEGYLLNPA